MALPNSSWGFSSPPILWDMEWCEESGRSETLEVSSVLHRWNYTNLLTPA